MVESAPLLREYRVIPYRGFESLSLRQLDLKTKKQHPNQYRNLDIKFDNLIKMYASGDPDMYNYKKLGIEPYWMKQQREEEEEKEKRKNEKNNTSNISIN